MAETAMNKQCKQCSKTFVITQRDQDFYTRVDTPPPSLCHTCREQRRYAWRNERSLYQRTCDNCSKAIISIYRPQSPYTVYCYECWWSDDWDPTQYGQEIDFSRPFFEQFDELLKKVPLLYSHVIDSENSDYTNGAYGNKDCYLIFVSDHNEASMYSDNIFDCVNVLDCLNTTKSELSYWCIGCTNCYNVQFSEDAANCRDSMFLLDCKGSSDCFMSYGLRNAQYVWRNQQLTQEEYEKRLGSMKRGSYASLQRLQQEFAEMKKRHTYKYYHGHNNEACTGDYIENSVNSLNCFHSYNLEDCSYVTVGNKVKDCMDCYAVVDGSELVYEIFSTTGTYNCKFGIGYWRGTNGEYTYMVSNASDVFGVVGLRNTQYSILNKQYSQAEYMEFREKLVDHMKQTGEYGEFFPVEYSTFAYNETVAQDYYPLSDSDVRGRGWRWLEAETVEAKFSTYRTPDVIQNAKDDILQEALTCTQCHKQYKILQQELNFYRQRLLPIPRQCFECRHQARLQQRNPKTLWHRQCMCTQPDHTHQGQCRNEFETTYADKNPAMVYCEECYNRSIG